jgi:hypothetical protein
LEKQSTNYCLWSNDLTQSSAWIDQTSNTTITQITSGGPDGGSFTRLVSTGSGSQGRIVQVGSITNPNGATMSVYLKGSGDTAFGLFIGNGISAYQNITLTNTWTRYVVTVSGVGGTYQDWQIGCVGGSTIDVSFVQVEQGVYATSPIPTTSSSATRVADLVPSKSTLLADKNSYSMFLDFYPRPTATFSYFFIQKNSSDTAEIIWGGTSGGTDFAIYDYTVSQSVWVGNINDGNRHKICLSVASGKIDLFVDGVQVITQKSTSQTGFYLVAIDGGPGVYKINEMVILSKITSAEAIALTTL